VAEHDVQIVDVLYNPPGLDVVDADEYVLIENRGTTDVPLTGWTLQDTVRHSGGHFVYRFPRGFVLAAGRRVKVWTGQGVDDAANLHWGRSWAVWNNTIDDIAVLFNAAGVQISAFGYHGRPPVTPPPGLSILAWNIAEGRGLNGNEQASLDAIAAALVERSADVVLLNEVCYLFHGTRDQIHYLVQATRYPHQYSVRTSSVFWGRGEKRVAILSKTPLTLVERIEHSHYFDGTGYATLHMTTQANNSLHHIFSTRLNAANGAEITRSCATLRDRINAIPKSEHVIIGGDFNVGRDRYDHESLPILHDVYAPYADFVTSTGLRHVLGGFGWDSESPDDHVLFRGPYSVLEARRDGPNPNPSDHPYVLATLLWRDGLHGVPLEDGTTVQETSGSSFYVVFGGSTLPVPDAATLQRLYGGPGNVVTVPAGSLAHVQPVPDSGTVLREENGTVDWLIDGGSRREITPLDALVRYGGQIVRRTVPDLATSVFPTGSPETEIPPRSWAEFFRSPATIDLHDSTGDEIDYTIEANAAGVPIDQVEFVLVLDAALSWKKELQILVDNPATGVTDHWEVYVDTSQRTNRNGLYRYQLPDGRLLFRKDRWVLGMMDVDTLHHLDQLPVAARVTFTWKRE
jgi:endonuclease/exonuclease/phosphatase family metal-dependent hydrolase